MAHYTRTVVGPMVAAERNAIGEQLHSRAKSLLCRSNAVMDDPARDRLAQLCAKSEVLDVVYQKRLELQQLWEKPLRCEELHAALSSGARKQEEVSKYCTNLPLGSHLHDGSPQRCLNPANSPSAKSPMAL